MMEIKRILLNRKSVLLVILCVIVNLGMFYYSSLRDYVPLNNEEIEKVDYEEKVQDIEKQIEKIKTIPIFQTEDNFVEEEKTLRDYKKIYDVKGYSHESEGISTWFFWSIHKYMILFFGIWLIFLTFETEKRGLFPLVYATPRGRVKLAAYRLFSYFVATVGMSFLLNVSMLFVSCIRTQNVTALFEPIQFVMGLQNCTLPFNGIGFVLFLTALQTAGIFVVILLCWTIFVAIHNSKIALIVCSVLFVIEYVMKQWIPSQSRWSMLKYVNVMSLLDVGEQYSEYHLHSIGGICLERNEWIILSIIVLGIVLSTLGVVIASKRRPFYQQGVLEKGIHYIQCKSRFLLCKLPAKCLEFYKVLVCQKALFVLVVFLFVIIRGNMIASSEGHQLTLGSTEEYLQDFYNEWNGPLTEDVYTELKEREEQVINLVEQENPAVEYYANGFKKLYERIRYAEKNKDERWLVNPSGYKYLIGEKGESDFSELSLLVLLSLLIIISGIFSFEKKSGMQTLIYTTQNGWKKLERRKYFLVITFVLIMWGILCLMDFYKVSQTYSLHGWNAPLHSLKFMENTMLELTIGQYFVFVYLIRFVSLLIISLLFVEITLWSGNQEISILIGMVMLVPSILYIMGLDSVSNFVITKLVHVAHFTRQGNVGLFKQGTFIICGICGLCVSIKMRGRLHVRD